MHTCHSTAAIRAALAPWHAAGGPVVLVPIWGALHAGHLARVTLARARADMGAPGRVIAALLPLPDRPCAAAPADLAALQAAGADAAFTPELAEFYPPTLQTALDPGELAKFHLGKVRPGQFRRLATGVAKLFNIIRPSAAVLGLRNYQALAIIRQLVQDLDYPIEVIAAPILREGDGVAVSAENTRLGPADRAAAPILARALQEAQEMATTGVTAARLRSHVRARLEAEPRARVQSVEIRDAQTLESLSGTLTRPAVILLAVWFGPVLLLDTCLLPMAPPPP
jgi:pantoate--beta-alanine ligase